MELRKQAEHKYFYHASIVITTCSNCVSEKIKSREFSVVIIDEATQCTEVETYLPLITAK